MNQQANHISKEAKIAVLLGGQSKERDVSLTTGKAIAKALMDLGYSNVHQIDPSEIPNFYEQYWDVVFIALHGAWGEDGGVQKILQDHHIAFTGSRAESSALAMSKFDSKVVFKQHDIPTLPFLISTAADDFDTWKQHVTTTLTYPIIGKPDCEGSSIGMEIVKNQAQLYDAFTRTHSFGQRVLWENYLTDGIDLTVGILLGEALPVVEIRPKNGIYDYAAKYTKGMTDYYCPARINQALAEKIQNYALQAFTAIGCRSWGRVDFIWKDEQVYCLEINTIPGMTPTSLVPMAAKEKGLAFEALVEAIVLDAI
ncbi:MAG: D-alanine--D-alanine ligase [Deltaproteobacteria bacterium]|nr:D-alanine--D-alanine ligase [Deltaproteobacteria bacterium]